VDAKLKETDTGMNAFKIPGYAAALILANLVFSGWAEMAHAQEVKPTESPRDYSALSVVDLEGLAKQGDPAAQYQLALRYHTGRGVGKDDALAAKWALMAAESARRSSPGSTAEAIQGAIARGAEQEKHYQWSKARETYALTLLLDPEHADAKQGYSRVSQMLGALRKSEKYLEAAEKLAAQGDFQGAIAQFNAAMAAKPAYLVTDERTQKLRDLLVAQSKPVEILLKSDGNTWVQIVNYRGPQKFETSALKILPGDYEALGRRKGYRDVVVPLRVRHGAPPPEIEVTCTVAATAADEMRSLAAEGLPNSVVGRVQDAKDRQNQDRLAQERVYQVSLAKARAEAAKANQALVEEIREIEKTYLPLINAGAIDPLQSEKRQMPNLW
jgi:TPR repeat protein